MIALHVHSYEVVGDSDEESVWVRFLFVNSDGSEGYFVVERAIVFDEQDKSLGMDTYYCELSDQGKSGYGLIESLHFDRATIVVRPNAKGQAALKFAELRISVESVLDKFKRVQNYLEQIFEGEDAWPL